MASLVKRGDVYYLQWYTGPRIRRRSLKTDTLQIAKEQLRQFESARFHGTGDSLRSIPFTEDSLINLLERLGVNIEGEDVKAKNVAAVIVTATLPPFARSGSQIDATISAIGDAKSLLGGTLVLTPLLAADGKIYAVAQGTVIVRHGRPRGLVKAVTYHGLTCEPQGEGWRATVVLDV